MPGDFQDPAIALGLAGIAIKAGARSTLATLWSVEDRASLLLVSEFYRQIRRYLGVMLVAISTKQQDRPKWKGHMEFFLPHASRS